jgi:hypothetical protein
VSVSIEDTIFDLLAQAPAGKTIDPMNVAKAVDAENWRRLLPQVRAAAVGLARQEKLVITRHNQPADPDNFRGVYRLALPGPR